MLPQSASKYLKCFSNLKVSLVLVASNRIFVKSNIYFYKHPSLRISEERLRNRKVTQKSIECLLHKYFLAKFPSHFYSFA